MAKQKAQQIQKLRIDKKTKTTILNYGLIKDNIKSLTKQSSLIKEEILPYFEKQNAIVLIGMDNGYEGYAQRINRQSKRFDMAKFKRLILNCMLNILLIVKVQKSKLVLR